MAELKPTCVMLDRNSIDCDDLDFSAIEEATLFTSFEHSTRDEVRKKALNAEIIIVNKVLLTREVLSLLPDLKLICVIATGTNNVDLEAAAESDIAVCNVRDYAAASVSQHVFLLILALIRRFTDYQAAIKQGLWQQQDQFCLLDYRMEELTGKTLGLIGYGHIGRAVEKVALAFGMEVVIAQSLMPGTSPSQERLPLNELYQTSDVISLHCPLTEQSRNLINAEAFEQMKPTSIIINAARGGIINEQDLITALLKGQIAGAGIDCVAHEPPSRNDPIINADLPQLIITPHNAWGTVQARQRLVNGTAQNIQNYLKDPLECRVN